MSRAWYELNDASGVASPALLVYPDRAAENIRRMVALIGDPHRVRPHVKTHKLGEIVRMHLAAGVTKFKAATIAEAEMCAASGVPDVLLAYPLAGPNMARFIQLARLFPGTRFSAVTDDEPALRAMSAAFSRAGIQVELLLDIDCGMRRTGLPPGDAALLLYQSMTTLPGIVPGGLHVYDGHIHTTDPVQRTKECDAAWEPVAEFRARLLARGLVVPRVVAGGTPTYPVHARRAGVECSPGTYVFWDFGYSDMLPDLPFEVAAVLLTRVVSKPGSNRICLDLGHKAVAPENPPPRVRFLNLPEAAPVMQSEEHLVLETNRAPDFRVGDCLYGVPRHICPTVALHSEAVVVRDGNVSERWTVHARARRLTI